MANSTGCIRLVTAEAISSSKNCIRVLPCLATLSEKAMFLILTGSGGGNIPSLCLFCKVPNNWHCETNQNFSCQGRTHYPLIYLWYIYLYVHFYVHNYCLRIVDVSMQFIKRSQVVEHLFSQRYLYYSIFFRRSRNLKRSLLSCSSLPVSCFKYVHANLLSYCIHPLQHSLISDFNLTFSHSLSSVVSLLASYHIPFCIVISLVSAQSSLFIYCNFQFLMKSNECKQTTSYHINWRIRNSSLCPF